MLEENICMIVFLISIISVNHERAFIIAQTTVLDT